MNEPALQEVAWPAESFFWAVLDAPALTGPLAPGLRAALEDEVPLADDRLHAVCAPMGEGRVLVCAAPAESLATLGPGALRVIPQSLPAFARDAVDCESLNLLVGLFEPRPLRRARARRQAISMATVMACVGLAAVGLVRRTGHWRDRARDSLGAAQMVAHSALPDGGSLAAAVDRARRESGIDTKLPPDAAGALAALLRAWPARVPSKPLTIAVGGQSATIGVAVDGDPALFLRALAVPAGWQLDEPRLTAVENLTRMTLTLHRRAPGATP